MLRDGNGDVLFLEQPPNGAVNVGTHVVHSVLGIGYPETQFEFDAAFAEVHEARHRQGIPQHAPVAVARGDQERHGEFRVVVVAHPHRQLEPDPRIGVAPVDDGVGDQLLVRDQHLDAVPVAHHDVPAAQLLDPAEILGAGARLARQADDVPGLDGAVHQEHESTDEIGGDGLQAEAQPQADRAGQHGERGEIDARGIEADENAEADQECIGEFRDADPRGGREVAESLQPPLDPAADPRGRRPPTRP